MRVRVRVAYLWVRVRVGVRAQGCIFVGCAAFIGAAVTSRLKVRQFSDHVGALHGGCGEGVMVMTVMVVGDSYGGDSGGGG